MSISPNHTGINIYNVMVMSNSRKQTHNSFFLAKSVMSLIIIFEILQTFETCLRLVEHSCRQNMNAFGMKWKHNGLIVKIQHLI